MADVVVAIDLGTSRSTCAYTLPTKAEEDIAVRIPEDSEPPESGPRWKTETAILLENDGQEVIAFGLNARRKFIRKIEAQRAAADDGCARDESCLSSTTNLLFTWFKAELCQNRGYKSVDDPITTACGGQKLPLLQVVTAALRHVKEDILLYLSGLLGVPLTVDRVKWVLTIPAIFDDFAKGFMRHAAFQAGMTKDIGSNSLVLCLEPEAACLAVNMKGSPVTVDAGCKIMILDCGGGTVDITTHEVLRRSPLSLKEILAPTGGPWGAICVDNAFRDWFREFLGDERYERVEHTSAFLDILQQWEDRKTKFRGDRDERLGLNLLKVAKLNKMNADGLQELCSTYNDRHGESSSTGVRIKRAKCTISLSPQLVRSFFMPTTSSIADCLKDLKRSPALRDLQRVFLVGGFSSSPLIQEVAKDILEGEGCKVILVRKGDVAIVKGAVLFASHPDVFRTRKARLTYGVKICTEFDPWDSKHVKHRLVPPQINIFGAELIHVFSSHIKVGDDIPSDGVCPASTYHPGDPFQQEILVEILGSHERDIEFPDKDICFALGSVMIPVDRRLPFIDRGVAVQFKFGGTELSVTCFSVKTGKKIGQTSLDIVQEGSQE